VLLHWRGGAAAKGFRELSDLMNADRMVGMDANLIKRVQSDSASSFKRGATENQIATAQKNLAVTFPPSYAQFLRHFNGGEFRFARVYRITPSGAGFFDLAEEMAAASEHFPAFRDRQLLLFGDDYSGNYFCFDLKQANRKGECPVVFWDRLMAPRQGPEHHTANFQDFVEKGFESAADES
jgi:hypothetical protein